MKECEFEPSEILKIHNEDKKSFISIRNLTAEGKAYKVKTTKPNNYVVRPSLGAIMPMEQVTIDVKLSENCFPDESHKFLIEVYDFDWKKSISTFKTHLKTVKPTPIVTHKLSVSLSNENGKKHKGSETSHSNTITRMIYISCYIYFFCILLMLFINIYNSEVC